MCYKNGKEILPEVLLKELQKYVQGEIIYIPKSEERKPWGEMNGTRKAIKERNLEIYELYKSGKRICEISEIYSLSEDSIRKIVFKINKNNAICNV